MCRFLSEISRTHKPILGESGVGALGHIKTFAGVGNDCAISKNSRAPQALHYWYCLLLSASCKELCCIPCAQPWRLFLCCGYGCGLEVCPGKQGGNEGIILYLDEGTETVKKEGRLYPISTILWSVGVHLSGGLTMNLSFSSKGYSCRVLDGSVMHSYHQSSKENFVKDNYFTSLRNWFKQLLLTS